MHLNSLNRKGGESFEELTNRGFNNSSNNNVRIVMGGSGNEDYKVLVGTRGP